MAESHAEEQKTTEETERPPEGYVWIWFNKDQTGVWSLMLDDGSLYHRDVLELEGHGRTIYRGNETFKIPGGPRAILEFRGNIACYTKKTDS